jgi:Ala-tRNA(Pro) deacylase
VSTKEATKPLGGDALYESIIDELTQKKLDFEPYEHAAVKTSEEVAKVRNTPLHEGAKALLLYADDKPIMVVVAGDRKLDMKAFKALYHVRDLRMGTPAEVEEITGVTIGAVPPFGHLFGIALYMDASLRTNSHVSYNAGLHTKSVRMKETDYEKIANPTVGEFSKDAS